MRRMAVRSVIRGACAFGTRSGWPRRNAATTYGGANEPPGGPSHPGCGGSEVARNSLVHPWNLFFLLFSIGRVYTGETRLRAFRGCFASVERRLIIGFLFYSPVSLTRRARAHRSICAATFGSLNPRLSYRVWESFPRLPFSLGEIY